MDLASLTITPERLSILEEPWPLPAAVLMLGDDTEVPDLHLPACPVIGVGSAAHPLSSHVDVLVQSEAALRALIPGILAEPHAAATLVQVLRLTERMSAPDALGLELMAYAMLQGSSGHARWKRTRKCAPVQEAGRVVVERGEQRLVITLDRPHAGNAIDRPMRDGLREALSIAAIDPGLMHVVLQGRGKAFSLGADLDEFGTTNDPATAHAIRMATLSAHAAVACADRMEARIDGACVGAGLELAAFCKRIVATPRSWFQLPELAMGIIPGAGGCVSIPRRIGRQRAALMMLSGRRIGARQALAWGLIDAVVDDLAGDEGGGDIG